MNGDFKITKRYDGRYKISIGTGKTFTADNIHELVYALEHYFHEGIYNKPFDYHKHIEHNKECKCCPLCRG